MKGYVDNIEKLAGENENFRQVLYTAKYFQLVLMRLAPGEEIGEEVHEDGDQFFRVERGQGQAIIEGMNHLLKDGSVIIVPAGTRHNIVNTSQTESLILYTLYSPPHHRDGVVHKTKTDALADDEEFDDVTTESNA